MRFRHCVEGVIATLDAGAPMATGTRIAFEKAYDVAAKFVEEHPVLAVAMITLIAIGILVYLCPYIVEALGFGELGPIRGKSGSRLVPPQIGSGLNV